MSLLQLGTGGRGERFQAIWAADLDDWVDMESAPIVEHCICRRY